MAKHERDLLGPVMETMRRRLADDLPLAALAAMAAMSERSFIRRFKASTGTTPAEWLTTLRVDRARELLETSMLSIDLIADQTGLGTATTLRHHFRRKLATSPALIGSVSLPSRRRLQARLGRAGMLSA